MFWKVHLARLRGTTCLNATGFGYRSSSQENKVVLLITRKWSFKSNMELRILEICSMSRASLRRKAKGTFVHGGTDAIIGA